MNKKLPKRMIASLLAVTMIGSGFTACSKEDSNKAYVLVNDDNAIILDEESFVRGDNEKIIFDFGQGRDVYEGYKISIISYHDKDELEAKVKALIGQDGQITYEEDYGKVK